jgi:hypothetical protein
MFSNKILIVRSLKKFRVPARVPMWYLPHTRTSATIHASLSAAVYHAPHGGCKDYILIVDIVIAFLPRTRTSATRVPMWYLSHTRTSATIHASLSAAVYHAPHGGCCGTCRTRAPAQQGRPCGTCRQIQDISNG